MTVSRHLTAKPVFDTGLRCRAMRKQVLSVERLHFPNRIIRSGLEGQSSVRTDAQALQPARRERPRARLGGARVGPMSARPSGRWAETPAWVSLQPDMNGPRTTWPSDRSRPGGLPDRLWGSVNQGVGSAKCKRPEPATPRSSGPGLGRGSVQRPGAGRSHRPRSGRPPAMTGSLGRAAGR